MGRRSKMPCAEFLHLILSNPTQQYMHSYEPIQKNWTSRDLREGDIIAADVNGSICPTGRNYARIVKWSNHKQNPKVKLEMLQYENDGTPRFQDCGWCNLKDAGTLENPNGEIWIFKHKFTYKHID